MIKKGNSKTREKIEEMYEEEKNILRENKRRYANKGKTKKKIEKKRTIGKRKRKITRKTKETNSIYYIKFDKNTKNVNEKNKDLIISI